MACNNCNYIKSTLYATNNAAQTVSAGGTLSFGTNIINTGSSISYTGTGYKVVLQRKGIYKISVAADILATEAGVTTLQLYNNTSSIAGAQATYTAVESNITHVTFDALVSVNNSCACINNSAILSAQLSAAGTVSNATIIVEKIA